MKIEILTLFPEMFKGPFDESIVKRAIDKKLVEINIYNLRKWTKDKHRTVDDRPFGGGAGMVMMVEPIDRALRDLKTKAKSKIILLSPRGQVYNQQKAKQLSKLDHSILVCGHYEGVDERVSELVDEEISIGDYVLTGGEIPALAVVDSVVRLIPKVLEKPEAIEKESFSIHSPSRRGNALTLREGKSLLEYPQYTRPADYKGGKVPEVLLSGNHKKIDEWRLKKSLELTKRNRPDLLKSK